MLEIFAYAFSIMYSPGPVNLLTLNAGLQGQMKSIVGFVAGVAAAMLIMFLVFGYGGAWFVNQAAQRYLALLGGVYMIYLSSKLLRSTVNLPQEQSEEQKPLSFQDGLLMQLLNPKGLVATLPICTVQFPDAGVSGIHILLWSGLLSLFAFGAPSSYGLIGAQLQRYIKPSFFRILNSVMAVLLVYVAVMMVYRQWWE